MRHLSGIVALCAFSFAAVPSGAAGTLAGPVIVVPAHDIERGETIADTDLTRQMVTPDRMRPDVAMSERDLVGREARRLLRAGEPVRSQDVRMPILVAKGSTVTMTFNVPGITVTATGRAMTEAGMGETVVVQNPVSFRQVSCVVTGSGEVRAGDATNISGTISP